MSEVHEASLTCEREDCATLKFTGPFGASMGCPAPGCGKSVGIGVTTAPIAWTYPPPITGTGS